MSRPKTYDREVALRRMTDSFRTYGYQGTSMRELMDATEMVPKSIYAEFGSKNAIFLAVLDAYVVDHKERYRALLGTPPLGIERIREYYESLAGVLDADGCLLVNSLAQTCTLPRAARTRIHGFFRWLEKLYRENLSAALAARALRPGADVDALAAALVAFDQGLAVASRCERQRKTLVDAALTLLASIRA